MMKRSLPRMVLGTLAGGALLGLGLVGGCPSETPASTSVPRTMVVSKLGFVLHNCDGTIDGFNLDDFVTTGNITEPIGCGFPDQVSPTGERGIDNNLAPTFESIVELTGDAVDGLIQMAINDGTLLVVVRLEEVDDYFNDPHVVVRIHKGSGRPQLGTNSFIAPSQTFAIDTTTPSTYGSGRIVDGIFYSDPFEAVIPLRIFGVAADMRMHQARIRGRVKQDETGCHFGVPMPDAGVDAGAAAADAGTVAGDGGMVDASCPPYVAPPAPTRSNCDNQQVWLTDGLIGGGIELVQIIDIANQAGAQDHNAAIIASGANAFLAPYADTNFDPEVGACTQISAALRFQSVPAFLIGDQP